MLLTAPFIVLDQNALRKPDLMGPAIERAYRSGAHLLILDIAVLEMMKHPSRWEETARHSLASLVGYREQVSIGRGVPALMKEERTTGVPALGSLIDQELSAPFRELLAEFQNPAGGPYLAYLRSRIADTQKRIIEAQYLQHDVNKRTLQGFRDIWKAFLPHSADRKRVRENTDDQLRILVHPTLTRQVEQLLLEGGHRVRHAQRIAFDRSVSSHWMLALLATSFRWFLDQGLDTLAAPKATNEIIDVDYITIGSLCSELISKETNVNETVALVRAAAEIRSAVFSMVDSEIPDGDAASRFRRHCELTPRS